MTGGYKGLQEVTGEHKGLEGGYRVSGLQGVTRGDRGVTWGYKGFQRVTEDYRGLQGVT